MTIQPVERFRRAAHSAYSTHPAARLYRAWRRFAYDPSGENCLAEVLLLPLTGLMLTLWVIETVPGASEAIARACIAGCMP